MAELDELYKRVDICERLLHTLEVTYVKSGDHLTRRLKMGAINYVNDGIHVMDRIVFHYTNEALINNNGVNYTLNYGHITGNRYARWINIPKKDLLFINKTIIQDPGRDLLNESKLKPVSKTEKAMPDKENTIFTDVLPILNLSPDSVKIDLWNEMVSQLIPAEAVETITRETINEALFETRLKIHEIKKYPYRKPSLNFNNFMPTKSSSYSMGTPLTPRSNQSTPPVSPRQNHTRRPVPRFARRKTQNVKTNNTPIVGLAPRIF
jgi:hypothetical protein